MLFSIPGGDVAVIQDEFPAGLVGTLTVQIENTDGTTHTAPSDEIVEIEAGVYAAELTAPEERGAYVILWSDGTDRKAEGLQVTYSLPEPAAPGVYATPGDVREALAGEGSTAGTAGALTDDDLQDAIDEATAEIDGRVPGAPFTEDVPRLVAGVTQDIAAYLATLKHRKGNALQERHPVQLRYNRALQLLDQMAAGNVDLTDDSEGEGASTGAVSNLWSGDLFSLEDLGLGVGRSPEPWRDRL